MKILDYTLSEYLKKNMIIIWNYHTFIVIKIVIMSTLRVLTVCFLIFLMHLSMVCPRMGGSGNPGEFDFVRRTWVGILTAILKSREDLGMSDEWCAILEITQN